MENESNVTNFTQNNFTHYGDEAYENDAALDNLDRIFRIITAIQATVGTLLNMMVVFAFIWMGQKRERFSNFLLFCTALSDLFVCGYSWMVYIVSYMHTRYDDYPYIETLQYVVYLCQDYSFFLGPGTILLCTIDRFISIKTPLKHREMTLKSKVKLSILIIWGLSFIAPLARLCLSNFHYENLYNKQDVIYVCSLHGIIMVMIFCTYVLLVYTCVTVSDIIRNPVKGSRRSRDNLNAIQKRNGRLVRIFIAIISAYTITYLPIIIGMVLHTSRKLDVLEEYDRVLVIVFGDAFYGCSSITNPLVTTLFKPDFKKTLASFVKKRVQRMYSTIRSERMSRTSQETVEAYISPRIRTLYDETAPARQASRSSKTLFELGV